MHDIHGLARIDLNLLVAFDQLLETRSVTRAAERLNVTQSAMSHTLRRLRALLDDPLLVRTGSTMTPTPRAQALALPIRAGLRDLGRAITDSATFEPASSTRTFHVTAPDLFDLLVLPILWPTLATTAPSVGLVSLPHPSDAVAALASGDLDLAIVPVQPELERTGRAEILRRTLFRDRWCGWVQPDHPLARGADLAGFLDAAHVLVSPEGRGPGIVDHQLSAMDRSRRVAVRVPHFATAIALAASTELVLTGPSSLRQVAAPTLTPFELPFDVTDHGIAMAWHRRFTADPGHVWLRERLVEVTQALVRG